MLLTAVNIGILPGAGGTVAGQYHLDGQNPFKRFDPDLFRRRDHIAQLWEDLEKQYNIFITMHDHLGSLRLADSTVLRKDGNIHRSSCCAFCIV